MSPLQTRRRRRRRHRQSRSSRALVVGAVVAVIVAVLLIGGAARTGSESTSYLRSVDQSFAAGIRPLAAESNATGRRLGSLVAAMAGTQRATLAATLGTLVEAARVQARQAAEAATPAPSGGAGADVAAAFADRAKAMVGFRRTVDRVLVMSPVRATTSSDASTALPATPSPLSTAEAAAALERVGSTLTASNRRYAAARRLLRSAPGSAALPSSAWTSGASAWSSTGAASVVAALHGSASLAAVHEVDLVADAVSLTPAPVPSASGATTASTTSSVEIPPTRSLSVAVVVDNTGNVPERHVAVDALVTPQTGGSAVRHTATVSLAPGQSRSVTIPSAKVVPGQHYTVAVTVVPPVADSTAATTSETLSVVVGPPSPPSIAQVKPSKGPPQGGTTVTIIGTGFTLATGVTFGTSPATFTIVSATRIKAVSPAGTGNVTVTVSNAGGPSGYSAGNTFTYQTRSTSSSTTTGSTSTTTTTTTTTASTTAP